ncbi:cupin domain-containing protein [Rhizobium sp. BR 314]|uniref:cupin domain-containing protein n=1 Tax=Rhizobium sp. BR 314 TaxID=3040013 RepID=UPI0039BF2FC9
MTLTPKKGMAGKGPESAPFSDDVSDDEMMKVGRRLRTMRNRHGLTIAGLAELSGVPASTISKIENGRLNPSLVNAINLAQSLNENLGFLIGRYRDPEQVEVVVRASDRQTIAYGEMRVVLQDLNGAFPAGVLEARVGILEPGARSGSKPMRHVGEELCYVIAGRVRYNVNGREYLLSANDYIQLKSESPHSWKCVSEQGATVIWVFSDGLSF